MRRAYSATDAERCARLPGDEIVPHPHAGYTLAITINATASDVWPWLVQMGQGRGGFYTHEWVENLLGAHIQQVNRIVPGWQELEVGDTIRLTPDPYLGQPGQVMTVADLWPRRALVFRHATPNGTIGSWAFVLRPQFDGSTRLLLRRRGEKPSMIDRFLWPGHLYMDRGMLHGLRERAEELAGRHTPPEVASFT